MILHSSYPDSKVHGANMGPIWGRQDPGGPHVGPMNFAIWISNQNSFVQMKHTWNLFYVQSITKIRA